MRVGLGVWPAAALANHGCHGAGGALNAVHHASHDGRWMELRTVGTARADAMTTETGGESAGLRASLRSVCAGEELRVSYLGECAALPTLLCVVQVPRLIMF